jgi:hypothetical protein
MTSRLGEIVCACLGLLFAATPALAQPQDPCSRLFAWPCRCSYASSSEPSMFMSCDRFKPNSGKSFAGQSGALARVAFSRQPRSCRARTAAALAPVHTS